MNRDTVKQLLDEFYPQLEALETQCAAIQQLLKDKGLATDEQFASYLDQSGRASSVKWLASRLRVEQVLSSALKEEEKSAPEPGEEPVETSLSAYAEDKNQSAETTAANQPGEKETADRKGEKEADKNIKSEQQPKADAA